ncbi:disulfide bond formation protein B [Streptomyces sp. NPDC005863]|uniref:disulfide bond formation protein B n=1 Tax=unclassified Streptomyces TaxID=2593676 RepID=UPI0033E62622
MNSTLGSHLDDGTGGRTGDVAGGRTGGRLSNRLGFLLAHAFVLAYCAILLTSLAFQIFDGDMPCPLCVVQRMAMLLCAAGPAHIIVRARTGAVSTVDYMAGYGLATVAAVAGAGMAARQVLLHLTDPKGYGPAVLGLHMYTWALVTFLVVIVFCALSFVFAPQLIPKGASYGFGSKAVVWLLVAIAVVITVLTFAEEGFHLTLPDDPRRYELFA